MNHTYRFAAIRLLLLSVFLLLVSGLTLSVQAVAADLTIGNYQLVSTNRINRTESEYTYKATITNTGSDASNVTATLSINTPGITVLSNQLVFGNVSAGSTATSTNTFIIRQDRNYNLDTADLAWQISAEQQTAEPAIPALRLTRVNPSSAASGAQVEIDYIAENMNSGDLRIVLDEQELLPDSVEVGKLRFTVPQGLNGGKPLFLRSDSIESNAVLFFVSETVSIVSPNEEDIITLEEDGSRVVVNHVLIFIEEGFNLDVVANAAAESEGGEVVGRIDPLRARQLRLPTATYEQLEAAVARLEALSGIEDVIMDVALNPLTGSVDWSKDPDYSGQRASNQVEQGVQAYLNSVHPTDSGKVRPSHRSIGVFENEIDFNLDDYKSYSTKGERYSNGIALYAPDCSWWSCEPHGSKVLGTIAATLGNQGSAGLLSAIGSKNAHSGFDIKLIKPGALDLLAGLILNLQSGTREFNFSQGVTRCDDFANLPIVQNKWRCIQTSFLQSNGEAVDDNPVTNLRFNKFRKAFDKAVKHMILEYPDAILVVAAGNGNTDAGVDGASLFGYHSGQPTQTKGQVIVVGGHDTSPEPSRYPNSHYGERVDIAASYVIRGSTGTVVGGTSYAAPLVTATIAAMRSIDPNLSPKEVLNILRSTAFPIENNKVELFDENKQRIGCTAFVRPLTEGEDENGCPTGSGARLDVEGAINAVIARRISKILQEDEEAGNPPATGMYYFNGDRIELLSKAELIVVYDNPNGKVIGFQQTGAKGSVVAGAEGIDGTVWLKVDFDEGIDGWITSDFVNPAGNTQGSAISSVFFEDDKFKQCVLNTASNKNWQTVGQVTSLNCSNSDIFSLTGIQNFASLQTLDVSNNRITSTIDLSSLTQLTNLNLSGNSISCIAINTLQQALPNTTIIKPANCTAVAQTNFVWPVKGHKHTQGYAAYGEVAAGKYHTGFDLVSDTGDLNVYAAAAGKVRKLPDSTLGNYNHFMGNTVIIDHNDGKGPFTVYSHLASIVDDIDNGTTVVAGQKIGEMGKTGCEHASDPCGVHLHFEVKAWDAIGAKGDNLGPWGYSESHPNLTGYINPYPYLDHGWQAYPPKIIRVSANQPIKTGPGDGYTQNLGNVIQDQKFAATQQVGNWYEIDFPSEYGPAKGWIQGEPVPENSTNFRKVTDPARGTVGVSVCNSPSACSNTANRLSYVWDAQHIVELEQAAANNGCTKPWIRTSLPDNQTGWVCGDYLKSSIATNVTSLIEDFSGTQLDLAKWNKGGSGALTITGGEANFSCRSWITTENKLTFSGEKIIVESRMVGPRNLRDTVIWLTDIETGDRIQIGDTNYNSTGRGPDGLYVYGTNSYKSNQSGNGNSVNVYKEYRLTLEGSTLTVERGDSLSTITETFIRYLPSSTTSKNFYLSIGTGGPDYCPGTFDWVHVNTVQ